MKISTINKIKFFLLLISSAFVLNSHAQTPGQGVPPSQESPAGMIAIDSEDSGPALSITTNVVYTKYGDTEVKLHFITPSPAPRGATAKAEPTPLIIYVPGSAWFPQDLDRPIPNMINFAKQSGYAIAIVAYRPSPIAKSPAQLVDIKASVRYMRSNAKRYNINPEKIAIWGTSSGGHMSSLVGVTGGIEKFLTDDNREQSSGVQAVVNFFGPTDFLKMGDYPSSMKHNDAKSPESAVIGGPIQDPKFLDKVEEYNPISYVSADKTFPPFLIMHGDTDALVPFNQSVILYEALRDAKQDVAFYKLKGAGHGDRFFTPQTLKIVQGFLDKQLK